MAGSAPHVIFLIVLALSALSLAYFLYVRLRREDRRHRKEVEEYLDLAGAVLIVVDREARIRTVNRTACEVFERPLPELMGASWFDTVVADGDREASAVSFQRIIAGNVPRGRVERAITRPDGTSRLIEWEFAVRRDRHGTILDVLASGQDITSRRAQETQLAGLHCLAQDIAAHDDARQVVVEHAAKLTGAAAVALVQSGQVTASSFPEAFTPDPALVARVLEDHAPVVDAHTAYQPVAIDRQVGAVLAFCWTSVPEPDQEWETLLGLLAQEMAAALVRLSALDALERAAVRDALTGVPNRRALDEELPRALARAKRSGQPLAMAMLDLNAFKHLNDTKGHEAGDRVLKSCAAAWTTELRMTDLLTRLGGDEFVALLPDCPEELAHEVAERLRAATPHQGGSSVGVATWDGRESGSDLLARADRALYTDKALCHRDRVADPARLAAVQATGLPSPEGDETLDEITRVARWLINTPIAALSMVDACHHRFASQCGLPADAPEIERSESFCQHAVSSGRPLIIGDASANPLVSSYRSVIEKTVGAYAGFPVTDSGGQILGVLCVIDDQVREWTTTELATLRVLADRTADRLRERSAELALPR